MKHTPYYQCECGCETCFEADELRLCQGELLSHDCWDDCDHRDEIGNWTDLEEFVPEKAQPTIPHFLLEISGRLHTQDNRITADPLFCVFEKQEIVVPEEMHHDRICWIGQGSHCDADDETAEKLESLRDDIESDHWHEDEIELDGETWRRCAIEEVDKFVTAALTEAGAQEHIDLNGHNLRRPFIYVTGLHRTPEMIELRKWLMSLTEAQEQAA